jgi:hypothetical protein
MRTNILLLLFIAFSLHSNSQDSSLTRLIKEQTSIFSIAGNSFSGEGWHKMDSAIKSTNNVLIGEDHFFNEVPLFVSAIAKNTRFDNFIIEIDPYSAALLQKNINGFTNQQFEQYRKSYGNLFSFFALPKELELLKQLANSKAIIMGTDQVLLIADRLLCSELKKNTKNKTAKQLYEKIETASAQYLDSFLKNPSKPFYMLTEGFEKDINELLKLKLDTAEKEQLQAMQLSARIYKEQSHPLRIQLMKNNLFRYYSQLQNKKNLFKFGAVHMCKGESLLGGYDLGNIVYNIADSRYEKSVHIMVVGKNGMQGSPFQGFPAQALDPVNGDLKSLAPFFNEVTGKEWYCFEMTALQKAIKKGKLTISDKMLQRVIEGYDFLVVIPTVTADSF